jgi:ABC-type multidrug transport system ATPase subunit
MKTKPTQQATQIYLEQRLPKGLEVGYKTKIVGKVEEDISLEGGKITKLIGRNGSGKSTLITTICRLIKPLRGESTWGKTCYLPEELELPEEMTVEDILNSLTEKGGSSEEEILRWRTKLELETGKKYKSLSKGNKQKVKIALTEAKAAETEACLVCLDEPLSGLDKETGEIIKELWEEDKKKYPNRHRIISVHEREINFEQILEIKEGIIKLHE